MAPQMCPDAICHHTAGLIKEIGPSSPELVKGIVVAPKCCPIPPKTYLFNNNSSFSISKNLINLNDKQSC